MIASQREAEEPMKRVLAITAALAALMLAGCEPHEVYEEENKKN
jgi:hypothetical protein